MNGKKKTTVDVTGLISKNLGMLDLVCIKEEENNNEEIEDEKSLKQSVHVVGQGIKVETIDLHEVGNSN